MIGAIAPDRRSPSSSRSRSPGARTGSRSSSACARSPSRSSRSRRGSTSATCSRCSRSPPSRSRSRPLARRLHRRVRGRVPEHVRRPDDDLSRTTRRWSTGSGSARGSGRSGASRVIAVVNTAVLVWGLLQLRPAAAADRSRRSSPRAGRWRTRPRAAAGGRRRRRVGAPGRGCCAARRPAVARRLAAGAAAAAAAPPRRLVPAWFERPSWTTLGPIAWLSARIGETPIRPDRSALLAREGRGRLDRLDLWLLVVLVVAAMGLRMFRLAEPARMHFDEVYHARTAAEFLQDWRYGISHDIYEWTHPHLAKYAMAAGHRPVRRPRRRRLEQARRPRPRRRHRAAPRGPAVASGADRRRAGLGRDRLGAPRLRPRTPASRPGRGTCPGRAPSPTTTRATASTSARTPATCSPSTSTALDGGGDPAASRPRPSATLPAPVTRLARVRRRPARRRASCRRHRRRGRHEHGRGHGRDARGRRGGPRRPPAAARP